MFLLQADRAKFSPVLAPLEFAFERAVTIPSARDSERDAKFGKHSGKPAAETGQMTRRARVQIVGKPR
jgi:hypothetical protein